MPCPAAPAFLDHQLLAGSCSGKIAPPSPANYVLFWAWNARSHSVVVNDVAAAVLQMLANHYPERLHKAYICNAPSIFSLAYKVCRDDLE